VLPIGSCAILESFEQVHAAERVAHRQGA
jgi:hypothetical protein